MTPKFVDFSSLLTTSSSKAQLKSRAASAPPPPTTAFAKKPCSSATPRTPPPSSESEEFQDVNATHRRTHMNAGPLTRLTSRSCLPEPSGPVPGPSRSVIPELSFAPKSACGSAEQEVSSPSAAPSPSKHTKSKIRITARTTRQCAYNKHFVNVLPGGTAPSTSYFISYGDERLGAPPHRELLKMNLQVGDVHLHIAPTEKQLWIYEDEGNTGKPSWKSIEPGYIRSLDKRGLSVTKDNKPSFVAPKWAHRGMKKSGTPSWLSVSDVAVCSILKPICTQVMPRWWRS